MTITPGEILKEEFLDPMGITVYQLCKDTALSQVQIDEVIAGKRPITGEIDTALSEYFRLSPGYWGRMQASCDRRSCHRPENVLQ